MKIYKKNANYQSETIVGSRIKNTFINIILQKYYQCEKLGEVFKMANNESNVGVNYEELGTSIKYYGIGLLILAGIVFLSGLIIGVGAGLMLLGSNYEQAFVSYINMLKGELIVVLVLKLIEFILFGNILKELLNSSVNGDKLGSIFRKTFKFFVVGVLFQVILAIISIFVGFQAFDALLDLFSDFYSFGIEDIAALQNSITGNLMIITVLNLIPLTLMLGGYLNFKKIGEELNRQYSYNLNAVKIKKGLEWLTYAAIFAIIVASLGFILDVLLLNVILGGLFSLVYLIFQFAGLYKTASGMIAFQPQISVQPVSTGRRPEEFGTYSSPQPSDIAKIDSEKICPSCGSKQYSGNFCAKCGVALD